MNRKKIKKRKHNLFLDFLVFAVLVFVLCTIFVSVKNYISYRMLTLAPAVTDTLEEQVDTKGLLICKEYLINAPVSGVFHATVQDGERVTAGAAVGYVETATGSQSGVTSPRAGIFSTKIDGMEEILKYENLTELYIEQVLQLLDQSQQTETGTTVPTNTNPKQGVAAEQKDVATAGHKVDTLSLGKGVPVAKITDNLQTIYLLIYGNEKINALTKEGRLDVSTVDNKSLKCNVVDLTDYTDKPYRLLELKNVDDSIILSRLLDCKIITKSVTGIVVPTSAVYQNDKGEVGVFYAKKGKVQWKCVDVIQTIGEKTVIEGVNNGTTIITNPTKAKINQKVY